MQITANNTEIFYQRHLGGQKIVLLHGWGGSSESMQGAFNFLSRCGCDVISLDLPGFGKSPTPPESFSLEDYAECVAQVINQLEFSDATIIGHSFGGRIAILLASKQEKNVKKLVLTAAAGMKPRFSLKKAMQIRKYKRARAAGKSLEGFGSPDYKSLDPTMRKIFVRIVNRHLDEDAKKIAVPTLLVWGNRDDQTPLYMAKRIKKRVQDCGLVTLSGGHFAYAERHNDFCTIVANFLNLENNGRK